MVSTDGSTSHRAGQSVHNTIGALLRAIVAHALHMCSFSLHYAAVRHDGVSSTEGQPQ